MMTFQVFSPDFPETYAFDTDSTKRGGRFVAFLIAVGMIPSRNIRIAITEGGDDDGSA